MPPLLLSHDFTIVSKASQAIIFLIYQFKKKGGISPPKIC